MTSSNFDAKALVMSFADRCIGLKEKHPDTRVSMKFSTKSGRETTYTIYEEGRYICHMFDNNCDPTEEVNKKLSLFQRLIKECEELYEVTIFENDKQIFFCRFDLQNDCTLNDCTLNDKLPDNMTDQSFDQLIEKHEMNI